MSEQEQPTVKPLERATEEGDHTTHQAQEPREPSQYRTAMMIADQLGETIESARHQITTIVRALGRTQARALLEETLRIEEQGGMMLPDGSRRRTPGGIFFHLAYTTGTPKPGRVLRRPTPSFRKNPGTAATPSAQPATPPTPPAPPFMWEDRIAAINEIGTEKGTATTVKITLIGKMGKFADKGACIVGVMQHTGEKLPPLPKGVPAPQHIKTDYVVYIAAKQWKTVAATVSDPEDVLIVEGFPQLDAQTGAISVFASNVTSKKLQAAKRQTPGKEGA